LLPKLRVERFEERLVEIGDGGNSGAFVIDGRKTHPAAEELAVHAVQRGDRPLKMARQMQLAQVVRVSDVVEELFKERNAQMGLRLLQVERLGILRPFPENSCREEAVERRLDK